jgi:asparagine synthetase B (glutamine-hydrolysing)
MTLARRQLVEAVRTLSSEGEAPTADRLATHIGLTYRDAEPSEADIEDALDELVREGCVRTWRVFTASAELHPDGEWITAYVLLE